LGIPSEIVKYLGVLTWYESQFFGILLLSSSIWKSILVLTINLLLELALEICLNLLASIAGFLDSTYSGI